jgi:ATP-dependent Clp protease adaptor protein ClpS
MRPIADPKEETDILEKESELYEIILYNDHVNTFDHVIACLMLYCEHDMEQAQQCAWITHLKGRCSVKVGSYDDLTTPCSALLEQGLSAEIC